MTRGEWYDTKVWKVGDKYWVYEGKGFPKFWGEIIDKLPNGEFIVKWQDGTVTNEGKRPEPASDYFKR